MTRDESHDDWRERALRAEAALERHGYRRCDTPACNCHSYHGGHLAARLDEIHQALDDAGIPSGGTVLSRVLAALSTPAPVAAPPADLVATCSWTEDANGEWHTGCGTLFVFDTDGPTEHKFGWCYHCGKPLAPVPFLLPEVPK